MNMMRNFGFFLLFLFFIGCGSNDEAINEVIKKGSSTIPSPITEYGFVLDSFQVKRDTVKSNWTMSHMFAPYSISQLDINVAAEKAADSLIGLRYVKEGTPFIILSAPGDTSETAEYIIYPQNIIDFVVFDFRDSVSVEKRSKPNEVNEKMLSGEIIKNLFIFDFYKDNKKSSVKLGCRFIFQSNYKTLSDAEINEKALEIINPIIEIDGVSIPGL